VSHTQRSANTTNIDAEKLEFEDLRGFDHAELAEKFDIDLKGAIRPNFQNHSSAQYFKPFGPGLKNNRIYSREPTMKHLKSLFFTAATAALFAGCATAPPQPSAPQTTQIRCLIPKIEALPETKESQDKGGLVIAVVPAIYKTSVALKTTVAQIPADLGVQISLIGQDVKNKVYVQEVSTPSLKPKPARLEFTVRINNKLDRVFRGQGSVVQFNVGGKLIPFGSVDYKDFINGIVPPRNESEVKIYGPSLDSFGNGLPEKGTIGIFLYDVVTATDVAGNTTAKQNYEWYFSYSMNEVQEAAEVKTKRGLMEIGAFQQAQMRQQQRPEQ
jgi:hypothetical protein